MKTVPGARYALVEWQPGRPAHTLAVSDDRTRLDTRAERLNARPGRTRYRVDDRQDTAP